MSAAIVASTGGTVWVSVAVTVAALISIIAILAARETSKRSMREAIAVPETTERSAAATA
jgi:hypothetical protein